MAHVASVMQSAFNKITPGERDGDNITQLDFVSHPKILSRFCECRDNRERDNEEKLALLNVMLKWISLRAKYIGTETFLHLDREHDANICKLRCNGYAMVRV